MPDLPFWIPVLWLAGVGPAGLAFAFIARHRTGSVAARAAWAKRAAVFWPGALLAGLFTVLGLVYGQLILCLVTIPADRHAAQRAAADAALRTAQRDLRLSEAASARLDEELRCQEAGEAGSGTLTAAVSSQGKAAISGGGVISSPAFELDADLDAAVAWLTLAVVFSTITADQIAAGTVAPSQVAAEPGLVAGSVFHCPGVYHGVLWNGTGETAWTCSHAHRHSALAADCAVHQRDYGLPL